MLKISEFDFDPDCVANSNPGYWSAVLMFAVINMDLERQRVSRYKLRQLGFKIEISRLGSGLNKNGGYHA